MQVSKMSIRELVDAAENFSGLSQAELAACLKESLRRHEEVVATLQKLAGAHRFNRASMTPNVLHEKCYDLAERIGLFGQPGESFKPEMLNDEQWRARAKQTLLG